MPSTTTTTSESAKKVLCHFAEHGGFNFTIYYLGVGLLKGKIDHTWEILSVTVDDKIFSFTACQKGQNPVEYSNRNPTSLKNIKKWFEEATEIMQSQKTPKKVIRGITLPAKLFLALKIKENFT